VSQKFVPYRPNYDLVGANIDKLLGTTIKTTYTATAADTYEYANIAIPISNTKVYEIIASTMYSAAVAKGIILASSNTALTGGYYIFAENDGNGNVGLDGSLSVHCLVPPYGANTIYVWVKYGAANKSNAIAVWYREIG